MSIEDQLIDLADALATQGKRRPNQASVRRAISTAYYALFHTMIAEATAQVLPARAHQLRAVVVRTFQHGTMKDVCERFSKAAKKGVTELPAGLQACYPAKAQIDGDIRRVCTAFPDLQDKRHWADYDLSVRVSRIDAVQAVQQARNAMVACRNAARRLVNEPFFLSLLLWKSMRKD